MNGLFATKLREMGAKRKIVDEDHNKDHFGDDSDLQTESVSEDGQLFVNKREFDLYVKKVLTRAITSIDQL